MLLQMKPFHDRDKGQYVLFYREFLINVNWQTVGLKSHFLLLFYEGKSVLSDEIVKESQDFERLSREVAL